MLLILMASDAFAGVGSCGLAYYEGGCIFTKQRFAAVFMFIFALMVILRVVAQIKDIKSLKFSWLHIMWAAILYGLLWARSMGSYENPTYLIN